MTAPTKGKAKYDPEGQVRLERAILGCLLERPALWEDASGLTADKFLLSFHRKVFGAIKHLHEHEQCADIVSVCAQLGEEVEPGDVSALIDNAVPENFQAYIRQLHAALRDREFHLLRERLDEAKTVEDRRGLVSEMQAALADPAGDGQNWRSIFHTQEEFENTPPLTFAVNGFLQESGVTLIGGLAGNGKTLLMLSVVKALLEESPLFSYELFSVPRSSGRVVYLIPESSLGPFWSRIKLFHLEEYVRQDRLLIRTLQSREQVELTDPRMLAAVAGADVFLDSVVRFTTGSENDAEQIREFSDTLFRLLHAGARTITGCHHSPKSFETAQSMTLENILRGSGDLGAMISTCWGVRQIEAARNRIYVENVKPRDFQPCEPFILEGRPWLDTDGRFFMHMKPGEPDALRAYLQIKGGRPLAPDRAEQIAMAASLRAKGLSLRQIAEKMNLSKTTVSRMLDDYDLSDHDSDEEGSKPQ
jgi:KaiC/GvpD/RAD55 family RecA-like ATPase